MAKTSGFFRKKRIFPEKTKWAFTNILDTYDSLIQLNAPYKQYDGSYRTYGDLVQALLTIVVETSSPKSQDYSPFQSPKPEMVNLHNGMFITSMTRHGVLSHLGHWLRKVSENNIQKVVEDEKFIKINENLLSLVDASQLKKLLAVMLEHKNSDKFIYDLFHFAHSISDEDHKRLLNALYNSLYIFSNVNKKISLDSLKRVLSVFLDDYEKVNFKFGQSLSGLIRLLDEVIESATILPDKGQEQLFDMLSSSLKQFEKSEVYGLMSDQKFINQVEDFLELCNNYLKQPAYRSGFLKQFISDPQLDFKSLHGMIKSVAVTNGNKRYFHHIFESLNISVEGKSNLVFALEELFMRKDEEIINFLVDMFTKFSRQDAPLDR